MPGSAETSPPRHQESVPLAVNWSGGWPIDFLDNAYDAVVCIDERSTIVYVNRACIEVFGYSKKEDLIGNKVETLMNAVHARQHGAFVKEAVGGTGRLKMNKLRRLKACRADGSMFPVDLHVTRLARNGQIYFAAFIRDMTEKEEQEQRLHRLVYYDSLTGLPNQVSVAWTLDSYFADPTREQMNMLVLGLDRMDGFNATFGHSWGDHLLKMAARKIVELFDGSLVIGRLRGRHFAVLTRGTPEELKENTTQLGKSVSRGFSQEMSLPEAHILTTFSCGCIPLTDPVSNTAEAMEHIDLVRNLTRDAGPASFVICSPSDHAAATEASVLPFKISEGLKAGDFEVYVQPKEGLKEGRCLGGECLIRWFKKDGTTVRPDQFIPVAEQAGLISDIGRYVFRAACDHLVRLKRSGTPVPLSVNMSPLELREPDVAEWMVTELSNHGLNPGFIELEITETAMTQFGDREMGVLNALRAAGFHIALDDFGTGASSLANLSTLPVDRVKLDRSFIFNIDVNPGAYVVAKHAIQIALDLGKAVTIEGVENGEIRKLVQFLGATEIQGYHYATPMAIDAFEKFLFQPEHKNPEALTDS